MKVEQLSCEYFHNPLGLDRRQPRLGWKLISEERGARQAAYRVRVASSPECLESPDVWDSGKIESDRSIQVAYEGPELVSRVRYFWNVQAWDESGVASAASETAWWEMGLLERGEWAAAQWIGAAFFGGARTTSPCPFLRRDFSLPKPVRRARLYATARGVYEFYLNGQRVGTDVFAPGWTDYRRRIAYQVHDVTGLLRAGANTAGAILGDGWYCGHLEWRDRQMYGDRPTLLAQIIVEYADGSRETLATDGAWKISSGPILEADFIMGESYDARREMPGWSQPAFDDSAWPPANVFPDPGVPLVAMRGPAIRAMEELRPVGPIVRREGWPEPSYLFDLGQNMVGRVRLQVNSPAGHTLRLRFAEVLQPNGDIYTQNLRTARATDYYTCRGGGEETWESRFTFHGFRYVEVRGMLDGVTADTITGIVLRSETPPTGEFECSDPLLNQLQHNIVWGQKGNFLDVPTDCPQRDERLGWTGDAQVFIRTAAFNMHVAPFFTKWQDDLADAQGADGTVPPVVPMTTLPIYDGGPAWADAIVICPWAIHLCYGDTALLAEHFESFKCFVAGLAGRSKGLIRAHPDVPGHAGFGDWLALDGGPTEGNTPKDLIGTAFYAYSARLVARIAETLGKDDEAARHHALFEQVRGAFRDRFISRDGLMAATQTARVLALHFDLAPPDLRGVILADLVRDLEKRGWQLSTGFVGTSYLPFVLSDNGRADVAYKLLHQKKWPSWLYAVTQGATTIWERWNGWTHDKGFADPGMNSFNHYAYGAIGEWMYRVVAGIDAGAPGYKHIVIRPRPGGELTQARAAFESVHGRIESAWRLDGGAFSLDVLIPPNTAATIFVPADDAGSVREGSRPAGEAEGLTFLRCEDGAAVYAARAGRYHFNRDGK